MPTYPIPENEQLRLKKLKELSVMDTAPEAVFDAITRLASRVCHTQIALIGFIDENRQWYKSNYGMPGLSETPREMAICNYTIMQNAIFELPNAKKDARFAELPYVDGEPHVRFYAGAPISVDGYSVGTLCVLDSQPKKLTEEQRLMLYGLAIIAEAAFLDRKRMQEKLAKMEAEHQQAIVALKK